MRTLKFLTALTILIVLVIVGCQDSQVVIEEFVSEKEECHDCSKSIAKIPIHENTIISVVSENEHQLTLPEDVYFIAETINNTNSKSASIASLGTAGVRCKCTTGSGCNPTKYDGEYSCVMTSSCTKCELKTSQKSLTKNEGLINIKGLVDYNKGITFLVERNTGDLMQDQFLSTSKDVHGNAFQELFELERVKTGINKFYAQIYGKDIPKSILNNEDELPAGYVYVKINIYGNIAAMPFPKELVVEQSRFVSSLAFFDKIKCKCHEGSGCTSKSAGMGSVKYCDAGKCKDCELID